MHNIYNKFSKSNKMNSYENQSFALCKLSNRKCQKNKIVNRFNALYLGKEYNFQMEI